MIGTDIIEVSRIEKLIIEKGDKFLKRIYTQKEINYCSSKGPNKYQHYAGRFAAKEAVFKIAAKKYLHGDTLKFKHIEILNEEDGTPYVNIIRNNFFSSISINISISHIKNYATAVAIMV
jgi:holo-[acyl-carrier protein] synthase